nr:hypothetical protein [Tanacetum cinerariifolium]
SQPTRIHPSGLGIPRQRDVRRARAQRPGITGAIRRRTDGDRTTLRRGSPGTDRGLGHGKQLRAVPGHAIGDPLTGDPGLRRPPATGSGLRLRPGRRLDAQDHRRVATVGPEAAQRFGATRQSAATAGRLVAASGLQRPRVSGHG